MTNIESFNINHEKLVPGLYVSRKDRSNNSTITTFDLRFTAPNREPVMDMSAIHTIEHLGAVFFRNSGRKDGVVYFGPMGCRTGFYLLLFGDLKPEDIFDFVIEMCDFILKYSGVIPGASSKRCGNYLEHNLSMAQYYVEKYKTALMRERKHTYS